MIVTCDAHKIQHGHPPAYRHTHPVLIPKKRPTVILTTRSLIGKFTLAIEFKERHLEGVFVS